MTGTQYNTLTLPMEEPKKQKTSLSAKFAATVVVACCAMFMAGRVNKTPVGYTHQEVLNVGSICAEGEFIGECVACKECGEYEYVNGGCTFFKDTFCSYCEPIANCQRENHRCTTRVDQICSVCDCKDPIIAWTDITKEEWSTHDQERTLFTPFSCYLGQQCEPCTPCKKGFYQTEACNPETQTDTVCARCTECEVDFYVAEVCTYFTDTVCTACSVCEFEFTTDAQCTGHPDIYEEEDAVHVAGDDTVCRDCKQCDSELQFVEEQCDAVEDTVCTACKDCEDGEFIISDCVQSDSPTLFGADKVCRECTELRDEEVEDVYLTELCEANAYTDFVYNDCTKCVYGEYQESDCFFGSTTVVGTDRVCQNCDPVANCPAEFVQCTKLGDSTCSRCMVDGQYGEFEDSAHWDTWKNCCDDDALGKTCGWTHIENGCDKDQASYRERTARRGGFDMTGSAADFVLWCAQMCASFEDCTAFEVDDCIAHNECEVEAGTMCGLKDHVQVDADVESEPYTHGEGVVELTCWTKPADFEATDLDYLDRIEKL